MATEGEAGTEEVAEDTEEVGAEDMEEEEEGVAAMEVATSMAAASTADQVLKREAGGMATATGWSSSPVLCST